MEAVGNSYPKVSFGFEVFMTESGPLQRVGWSEMFPDMFGEHPRDAGRPEETLPVAFLGNIQILDFSRRPSAVMHSTDAP